MVPIRNVVGFGKPEVTQVETGGGGGDIEN